jgi:hypothetical protein
MKSFNALARIAYAAYVKRSPDKLMPQWADLTVERQAGWIEAVKAVAAEVAAIR